MFMVGGYFYLIRLVLYSICEEELIIEKFLEEVFIDSGIYWDYFSRYLEIINKRLKIKIVF